jgi:hypothetical protein
VNFCNALFSGQNGTEHVVDSVALSLRCLVLLSKMSLELVRFPAVWIRSVTEWGPRRQAAAGARLGGWCRSAVARSSISVLAVSDEM